MLNFINFLKSAHNMSEDELKNEILKRFEKEEVSNYSNFITPGSIVDLQVGEEVSHGIVLANNALMLINPKMHKVIGYLTNYTDITPYKMIRIRQPDLFSYKYTDPNIPVVWESEPVKKTEMSLEDIEKALGIKSGTLVIK